MKVVDMAGKASGHLIVVERASNTKGGQAQWLCICDCGNTTVVSGTQFRLGKVKSCGCRQMEACRAAMTFHGMTFSRTWKRWVAMKRRCNDPAKASSYLDRGIAVCESWKNNFKAFLNDMGECPSDKHTLDRIDNDRGYEPGNCRWATMKEQCQNRRPRKTLRVPS